VPPDKLVKIAELGKAEIVMEKIPGVAEALKDLTK
jgi:hypothetical protein